MPAELKRWLLLLRVPLALLGVVFFFTFYNRFILDVNLRNLQASISIMDKAGGVGQAEAALLLVDQTLNAQMAREETDLQSVAVLQYAKGALASDHLDRPPDDAQAFTRILKEDTAAQRQGVLKSMDGLVSFIQGAVRQAVLLPRRVLEKPLSPEIDTLRLEEAAHLEKQGRFEEAAYHLQNLLQAYPDYEDRAALKLRMGYLLQKAGQLVPAEAVYREALAQARDPKELLIARQRLQQLDQLRAEARSAQKMQAQAARAGSGAARQRAEFKLGCEWIRAAAFDQAAEAFRQAALEAPEGDLALPALFKEGWCLRSSGRLDDAFTVFYRILKEHPKTEWAGSSYLQIAEIYKFLDDFQAAAQIYERAGETSRDGALAAIAYAQAGCTYLFDLNDVGKAQALFRDLAKRFPASSYGSIGRRLEEIRRRKGGEAQAEGPGVAPPSGAPPKIERSETNMFAAGSPLLNWLENFLPIFVSVFTERLYKYMEAVGETSLARRFTDREFEELVVREVQRLFPGQVTGMKTQIHPDGFVGSGNVHLAMFNLPVEARVGILVRNERPHAVVQGITVGKIPLPNALLKLLETRINATIDQKKYPLKVKEYKLNEGYAWISVEVAD